MSPSDSSHSSWESPFDSSHSSWESTSDSDSDSGISNSVLSSSRSSSEPTSLLSEGLTSVYHKVFPGSNFTRLLGGAASGLRRFDPLQRRPAESSISGRRGAWQVETQSQPEAAGQRVTQRAVVMAAPEPSLAARSPAAPPEQQEGAGDSADPELDSVSSAAPELPGTPAALDAPLQAEAAPRPGTSRPGPETFRQRFRQFRYQDAAGPREAFRQLRELSRQWLRPDIRTKEQIVEMLVQEQLQAILPEAARARRLRRRADVRITG